MADRFKFTDDFDFKPTSQVTVAFPKGFEGEVITGAAISGKITKAVAVAAAKAGKGGYVGGTVKPAKVGTTGEPANG